MSPMDTHLELVVPTSFRMLEPTGTLFGVTIYGTRVYVDPSKVVKIYTSGPDAPRVDQSASSSDTVPDAMEAP